MSREELPFAGEVGFKVLHLGGKDSYSVRVRVHPMVAEVS